MRRPIPLIVIVLALALPASALGAGTTSDRIYYDCEHSATGYLTGHYSTRALRDALKNPPADVSEYSGCDDAIRQALLAGSRRPGGGAGGGTGASGGGGGNGSGNGSGTSGDGSGGAGGPSTPPHVGTKAPVTLAGTTVRPGAIPSIARDPHGLPTPLVVVLALLGAAVLAAATTTMGRRVVAHRRA
jgi:hypothetical protein